MPVILKDIAARLNLSVTTVSRALGGYPEVAAETRQRVLQAAEEMAYHPDVTAQRLQKRRTDTSVSSSPPSAPASPIPISPNCWLASATRWRGSSLSC